MHETGEGKKKRIVLAPYSVVRKETKNKSIEKSHRLVRGTYPTKNHKACVL